jgi:hypothetical protein
LAAFVGPYAADDSGLAAAVAWKMVPAVAPPRSPAAMVRASATSSVRMWSAIE